MDEADRQLLRRCRVRLVSELQVAELWDALLSRELFTRDMIEDIQASHLQFPGAVYGTDGCSVLLEKIVSIFNGTGCPSLGGKPKLFFIQACGGGPLQSWASLPLHC